jgi:hypothetical protein
MALLLGQGCAIACIVRVVVSQERGCRSCSSRHAGYLAGGLRGMVSSGHEYLSIGDRWASRSALWLLEGLQQGQGQYLVDFWYCIREGMVAVDAILI